MVLQAFFNSLKCEDTLLFIYTHKDELVVGWLLVVDVV